jgi:DNA topoisomerase-3
LPVEHHRQASDVIRAVTDNLQSVVMDGLAQALEQVNVSQKSKAWNNAKVDAHHAIIPTQARSKSLTANELKVYQLICRNYLAQFLAHYQFEDANAEITIAGGTFIAKAKKPLQIGWKVLFPSAKKAKIESKAGIESEESDQFNRSGLPKLKKGQTLNCIDADIVDKQTTPPKPFTDATLLAAMTGISRFVSDPALKQVLKETDGLGTEATRAGIMELLFKRGFLSRQGKSIRATPAGKGFIQALPESATLPDMTARWESLLTAISERQARYDDLMLPLQQELQQLVMQSQQVIPVALKGLSAGRPAFKRKRKSSKTKTAPKKTTGKKTAAAKS